MKNRIDKSKTEKSTKAQTGKKIDKLVGRMAATALMDRNSFLLEMMDLYCKFKARVGNGEGKKGTLA